MAGLVAALSCMPVFPLPFATLAPAPEYSDWQTVQTQGANAFEAAEYGKAERLLREAVTKARSLGADDERLSKSPGDLGRLLTVRARFTEAEPYLEEELRIKERAWGFDSSKIIPSMGSLIRFYLTCGSAESAHKADKLTEELLLLVEGKMRQEILRAQAHLKMQKGTVLQGFAGMADPVMHEPLIEWAITCDDLGTIYSARGKYDIADRLFKAALDAKASVLGKQHLSLANSYDSLAVICEARGEFREAESYFRQALDITGKILMPDDPQIYARIDRLARCLIKEKKYDEAESLYLGVCRQSGMEPAIGGYAARSLFALGCLYADEKKYASAVPVLRRGLRLSERINGDMSVAIVPYLRKYAYVAYYLGQRGEQRALIARADSIAPEIKPLKTTCKMESGDWTKKNVQHASKLATKKKQVKMRRRRRKKTR